MRLFNTISLLFCLLLMPGKLELMAQEVAVSVEVRSDRVSADPFSNLYLIDQNGEYRKYSPGGRLEARYSDVQIDATTTISAGHPFKSMLFYPPFDRIRVFGNKLQILAELDLAAFGLGEVTAVAPNEGYQSFWVFDATAQQLVRINQQYGIEFRGTDLLQVIGEPLFPTRIKERDGWIYLFDPEKGLFIFDSFGTYSTRLQLPGATSFSVFRERIFFTDGQHIFEADPATGKQLPVQVELNGRILSMSFRTVVVDRDGRIELIRF